MNAKDFDKIVAARMVWCNKTLCAKGDEYARDGDRLWNFKVAARKLNCHPAEALAGMMVKHTVSVDDIIDGLARGIVPPPELVAEKIGDSINYLLLLEGLIEEARGEVQSWQTAVSEQDARRREQAAMSAQRRGAMDDLASACRYNIPPRQEGVVHIVPEVDAALKTPMPEVYGGYVVCSRCGLKCSIGSEQEQSVSLTGRCAICRDEKERETYTVPPLQDGDDEPVVHYVPDKTSRGNLLHDDRPLCPEDAL